MSELRYGDKVVLKSGEVGKFAGFLGRGRDKILVDLAPSADGKPRCDMVSVKEVVRA